MSSRAFSTLKVTPIQKTPLFEWASQAMQGKMVPFAGYEMPVEFKEKSGGILKEHLHTRSSAGLFDVSHMGQVRITGRDRTEFLDQLIVTDLQNLPENSASLGLLMLENGGIKDDLVITKFQDYYQMVVNGACKYTDLEHIDKYLQKAKADGKDVNIELFDDRGLIALQGPKAAESLQKLVPQLNLSNLKFMQAAYTKVNALNIEVLVTRCGYTGEDGFEISVDPDNTSKLADLLVSDPNILPVGLGARDSLRLEAGLCLYGHDLDENTTPIEAALNWTISKTKKAQGGFLGDSVVLDQIKNGSTRKRVGLSLAPGASAREGTPILNSAGEQVGQVTSGSQSPVLKHPIAMGYVKTGNHKNGTELQLQVRNKTIAAKVSKMPFIPSNYYK